MKTIVLIDGSKDNFCGMVDTVVNDKVITPANSFLMDTQGCDEEHEYKYLLNGINNFSQLEPMKVMMVRFSGRESILKNIGDICPEMVVNFSYNKNSMYYIQNPSVTISKLLNTFDKENN